MAFDIEERIVVKGRALIEATLTSEGYRQLDYQEVSQFDKNNFMGKFKRYGWTSAVAVNAEESAPLRFQSFNQQFNFILMTDYNNKDDDTAQELAKSELQKRILEVVGEMRKTKVNGVREVCNVIIGEIDDPEFLDDNSAIAYVTTVIVNYRYRVI